MLSKKGKKTQYLYIYMYNVCVYTSWFSLVRVLILKKKNKSLQCTHVTGYLCWCIVNYYMKCFLLRKIISIIFSLSSCLSTVFRYNIFILLYYLCKTNLSEISNVNELKFMLCNFNFSRWVESYSKVRYSLNYTYITYTRTIMQYIMLTPLFIWFKLS